MTGKRASDPERFPALRLLGRRAGFAALGLLAGGFFHQGLLGQGGLTEMRARRAAVAEREARAQKLREANRALEESVNLLRNDRAFQEREARARLGYVRPGEIVYRDRSG